MPVDATGTPTNLGIPTFNVDADAPSGLGFNAAMLEIDALIAARMLAPTSPGTGDVPVWNGTTWVKSSTKGMAVGGLDATGIADGKAIVASGAVATWGDATPKVYTAAGLPITIGGAANTLNTIINQSIPGGSIVAGSKRLRVTFSGRAISDATAYQIRLFVSLGGVTLFDSGTTNASNGFFGSSGNMAWDAEFLVTAYGDNAHATLTHGGFTTSPTTSNVTTGTGNANGGDLRDWTYGGPASGAAVNLTTAQTLLVQIAMSQASSAGAREMYVWDAMIEVVG